MEKRGEMAVWTIIKYKPLEGCIDAFLEAARRLEDNHPDKSTRFDVWTKIEDNQVIQIGARESVEKLIDNQDYGLGWLESVDHLLEKDSNGSRTEPLSAYEVEDLRRTAGKNFMF